MRRVLASSSFVIRKDHRLTCSPIISYFRKCYYSYHNLNYDCKSNSYDNYDSNKSIHSSLTYSAINNCNSIFYDNGNSMFSTCSGLDSNNHNIIPKSNSTIDCNTVYGIINRAIASNYNHSNSCATYNSYYNTNYDSNYYCNSNYNVVYSNNNYSNYKNNCYSYYNRQSFSTYNRYGRRRKKETLSPYEILKVETTATAKEIKLAYFREAKKHHPDMNPNDPNAKEQFQKVAAAYELLSDERRRKIYDESGDTNTDTTTDSYNNNQEHAEEVFRTVQEDFDVIKEALSIYTEEIQEELNYIRDCVSRSDWNGLYQVAKNNKGIIFSVVVPLFLIIRYPPVVFALLRFLWAAGQLTIVGLLYSGQLELVAKMLWKRIVALSIEQKKRKDNR